MTRWTQDVLQELKMKDWASIFRFTSVVFEEVYQRGIFEKALWYRPDSPSSTTVDPLDARRWLPSPGLGFIPPVPVFL